MDNAKILDILGYSPELIAEAELIREAERVNALMGPYAKANNTLEGFAEFVTLHDEMLAGDE